MIKETLFSETEFKFESKIFLNIPIKFYKNTQLSKERPMTIRLDLRCSIIFIYTNFEYFSLKCAPHTGGLSTSRTEINLNYHD